MKIGKYHFSYKNTICDGISQTLNQLVRRSIRRWLRFNPLGIVHKVFTKHTQSELVKLTGYSKSYISMILSGQRPVPASLGKYFTQKFTKKFTDIEVIKEFLTSREASGCAPTTLRYYRQQLSYFQNKKGKIKTSQQDIECYLNSIPPNQYGLSNRHAAFRALHAFYNWYSTQYEYPNPMKGMTAPIQSKPILPSLTMTEVKTLIDACPNLRDKAIVALFAESGLRLSELVNITAYKINWDLHVIQIMGKGRKEA
jgi:integrase